MLSASASSGDGRNLVAVGVLDKPIRWQKQQVKFVFMLCIQKDSDEALIGV